MAAGERLIGEHEGLQVDPDGGGSLGTDTLHPPNAGAHPTLTATNADVIALDDGNEIRGLNIDPQGTGGGIAGGTGDTGGARSTTSTSTTPARPERSPGSSSTERPARSTSATSRSTTTRPAVLLNNAGTVNFTPASTITIASAGAPGLTPPPTWARARSTRSRHRLGHRRREHHQHDQPDPWATTFGDLRSQPPAARRFPSTTPATCRCRRPARQHQRDRRPGRRRRRTSGATLAFDTSARPPARTTASTSRASARHVHRDRRHDRWRLRDRLRP